jgi:hypothetical protein
MPTITPQFKHINPISNIEIYCKENSSLGITDETYTLKISLETEAEVFPLEGSGRLQISNRSIYRFENNDSFIQFNFAMIASTLDTDIDFKIRNIDLIKNSPYPLFLEIVTYERNETPDDGIADSNHYPVKIFYSGKTKSLLSKYKKTAL